MRNIFEQDKKNLFVFDNNIDIEKYVDYVDYVDYESEDSVSFKVLLNKDMINIDEEIINYINNNEIKVLKTYKEIKKYSPLLVNKLSFNNLIERDMKQLVDYFFGKYIVIDSLPDGIFFANEAEKFGIISYNGNKYGIKILPGAIVKYEP